MTITDRIDRYFGPFFSLVPGPMPEGALREIIRRESAGKPRIVVADMVTGASELGGTQLVVEHDAKANPNMAAKTGAIGANVDPLEPLGAIYGAQYVYQRAKRLFVGDMIDRGIAVPPEDFVRAWISILHFQHSIGRTGFKMLMSRGAARGMTDPIAVFNYFATKEMPPRVNRQSPEKVRMRLLNLLDLPTIAARWAPLPPFLRTLVDRPDGLAAFDKAKAKRYILAERARVKAGRPRKADGSPL